MSSTSVRSTVGVRTSSGAIRSPCIAELPLRARPAGVDNGGESRPFGADPGVGTAISPGRADALRSGGSNAGEGARNDVSGRRRASGSRSTGGADLTTGGRAGASDGRGDGRGSGVTLRDGMAMGGIDRPRPREPLDDATLAIECVRIGRPSPPPLDNAGEGERNGGEATVGTCARLGAARGEGGRGGRAIGTGSGIEPEGCSRDIGPPIAPRMDPPGGGRIARGG